jgi:hypothetical protein
MTVTFLLKSGCGIEACNSLILSRTVEKPGHCDAEDRDPKSNIVCGNDRFPLTLCVRKIYPPRT